MSKSFLVRKGVPHVVNGETLMFYPVSVKAAASLSAIGKPIAQAVSALFSGVGNESGQQERVHKVGEDVTHETIVLAIDPKLAEVKLANRNKAIEALISALTDQANLTTLAKIIMDSLRDDYPPVPTKEMIDELLSSDIGTLAQLVEGVLVASQDSFSPLLKRLLALRPASSQGVVEPRAPEAVTTTK